MCNIKGIAIDKFTSNLNNRLVKLVKINNTCSERLLTKHGVPQGTLLGLIIFIIYVNNI